MALDEIPAGSPEQVAGALADRFRAVHGHPPVGCFAAPGRVNLIGEHVDYNGGKCLPMALPHATYAAVRPRADDRVTIASMQRADPWQGHLTDVGPGQVTGWAAYVAGVLWALQEDGVRVPGLDVLVDSRVPVGAGLSSSAALECSVALGACAVAGLEVDDDVRRRLVAACIRAEVEVAGAPTGGMDQTASLLARSRHALLLDCQDWSTEQVPWDPEGAGLRLLVVDTRAEHQLADGGYAARRADCERAAAVLGVGSLREVTDRADALDRLPDERVRRRVGHVFTEMTRVDQAVDRLRSSDYVGLGQTFTASHASLRDDYEVSSPELDVVVDTALDRGALGARMTGGGFGGSAIALVREDAVEPVAGAVAAAFQRRAWAAPGFLVACPADGAHRVL